MTAVLDSLLLSSDDPKRLSSFYAEALGLAAEETPDGHYRYLNVGGFYVMFDSRDDVSGPNREPGRVICNISVDDVPATAERFVNAGARWLAEPENRDGSWFATLIDPDGNYVQLIHIADEHMG
ncbi:VOC family protein [Thermocrispum municipale]|jgi:predicted enzyme related to lactoylglutathione lyase|uniref:VOC family protein n=1 Tax=Thermocrispum municipale TaxID=37926 RepID=UPI0004209036|nr:VOC family protein [Thermocrispum municipale]